MKVVSVALAANYSAVLSLQGLDTNGPIGFGVSVAETSSDAFVLYGTLDSAAVDNTNAQNLGVFSGGAGNLPPGIANQAKTWPFLLVQRTAGATAGNLFVAGNPAASPAVVTTAAPVVVGNYSALMTLTTLGAQWIRLGGSRAMTASDVFNVYLSNDPALASSTGAYYAGQIRGGGGTNLISVLVSGYNYAIIQRVSGSTAGNMIAAGVAPSAGGGILNLTALAVGDTAVNGPIGGLTAAQTVDIYSEFLLTQATLGVTATLPNPTITTPGKFAKVVNDPTSASPITMYGEFIDTGRYQIFNWTGSSWAPSGDITSGGNAFGGGIIIGSNDNNTVSLRSNGTTFLSDNGTALTAGRTAGASSTLIQSGTGGVTVQPAATGPLALNSGTTGAVSLDSGTTGPVTIAGGAFAKAVSIGNATGNTSVVVNAGTGNADFGANATDHSTRLGSVTGVSQTTVQGGTAGVLVQTATTGPINVDTGTTGAINIGIGVLGSKQITIGVVNGTTGIQLSAGTGGIFMSTSNSIIGATGNNGAIQFTASGSGNVQLTPGATGVLLLPPRAAGAGNTTRVAFQELAASGTNVFTLQAPDAIAADVNCTLPDAVPTINGQSLVATTAGVMSWAGAVHVQATTTNAQSIADGAAAAIVTTWTESLDTAAAFDAATGIFTAPATGFYLVTAELEYSAIASIVTGEFTVQVFVNGALAGNGVEICQVAAANVKRNPKVCIGVQVTAGQTIDIRASQNSGSGANTLTNVGTRNFLSITQVL